MTRSELHLAIARQTGESLATIRHLGFGLNEREPSVPDREPEVLFLDCPFCGHPERLSSIGIDGLPESAECSQCDIYFDYSFEEIYATKPPASEQVA